MTIREHSFEVLFVDDPIVQIRKDDLQILSGRLPNSENGRVRICAHGSDNDAVHEMLILLSLGSFVRPHKHPAKSESFHVIEGKADVIIFDDQGNITDVIRMGGYHSGLPFFYRLARALFHTIIVRTETVLIHETTNGPFVQSETIYAPWAPCKSAEEVQRYMHELDAAVLSFMSEQERFAASQELHP